MSGKPYKETLLLLLIFFYYSASVKAEVKSCMNSYDYSIYLSGIHTGSMQKIVTWYGSQGSIKSNSSVSLFGIGTRYQQQAKFIRSASTNGYLTTSFEQQVSGFRQRKMEVTFSLDGSESVVNLDGETTRYSNNGKPLRDVDTLMLQIQYLLKRGETYFELTRQATDGSELYHYQVINKQREMYPDFGELDVIQLEQTGAEQITFWLAPSLNYSILKATYHGFLFNGSLELEAMDQQCL